MTAPMPDRLYRYSVWRITIPDQALRSCYSSKEHLAPLSGRQCIVLGVDCLGGVAGRNVALPGTSMFRAIQSAPRIHPRAPKPAVKHLVGGSSSRPLRAAAHCRRRRLYCSLWDAAHNCIRMRAATVRCTCIR
ncbi:hypothetical protein CDEST_04853 [Colletotrichum destructivum]|uniref:Uncharacterized protein n=1 Tax=Colletotrichum destructivum TaxID=34406 RepID=A0AAX4IA26_9PEZI|nr:hypothetical protein CDEST_04853 [Colletotrichum destructivum]